MAVRLRLRRVGRKKLPIYKVVAADSRSPRDGRFIESIGQYDPLRRTNNVEFKEERVLYWLRNGAKPTDTVRNLLQKEGIWLRWSLLKRGKDEGEIAKEIERFSLEKADREIKALEKDKSKKKAKAEAEKPQETASAAETAVGEEPQAATDTGAEGTEPKTEDNAG